MLVCICLSIYLSTICSYICLASISISKPVHIYLNLFVSIPIYPSSVISNKLIISLYPNLFISIYLCLFVYVYLYIYPQYIPISSQLTIQNCIPPIVICSYSSQSISVCLYIYIYIYIYISVCSS